MKKHLLSILTIVLAVAGSAFTLVTPETKATQDCVWFIYDDGNGGAPSTLEQAVVPSNYRLAEEDEQDELCQGTSVLCAICAEPSSNPSQPMISSGTAVQNQLQAYFQNPNLTFTLIKEKP